jgi:hypothetical protein
LLRRSLTPPLLTRSGKLGPRKSGKGIRLKGDNASLSLLDATDAEALSTLSIGNHHLSEPYRSEQ